MEDQASKERKPSVRNYCNNAMARLKSGVERADVEKRSN
jgi:hypothetical protein